ncbi:MAG TPA: hypothetical protein VIH47_08245, partial [Solirubrobacterales bacterium]
AGHPPVGFTQIIVRHSGAFESPVGNLKTVLVDLPVGMSVNPQATPQCALTSEGKFPSGGCPADTQVGESIVTASVLGLLPTTLPGFPVYNIVPRPGEPARFGFDLDLGGLGLANLGEVFLNAGVNWDGDYHEYFTIHVPEVPGNLAKILKDRLVFDGTTETQANDGRFLTTPSTCGNPEGNTVYSTFLHADSYEESAPDDGYDVSGPAVPPASFVNGSQGLESPLPRNPKGSGPRERPTGCGKIPFAPTTSADPGTTQTDSPGGATVNVKVPFDPNAAEYQSNVKDAVVTLPKGMGINPSAANGLHVCTDAEFRRTGTRAAVACPANSKIGTVAINTPVLPDGTLTGPVFLGNQVGTDPESGNVYRVFLDAESASRGLSVRLLGNVSANKQTGQLTAVVREAPELPFDSVQVKLNGGPTATLTSPPTCGPNATSHAMTAWSGTPDGGAADKGFTLSSAPGGGPCASTLAGRPFGPSFVAKPNSEKAEAFTPFQLHVNRSDGQQELKGVDITLPPGATAKLKGVPYCSAEELAKAAARTGAAQKASKACDDSLVGSATIAAGSGPSPLEITGKAYLAGPYKGAPLSMAVITPALAGPYDLGTVVVRVALFVDSETAQIHAVSDPIPDVFGGVKLDVRSVSLNIDKDEFTLNGTNCSKLATTGSLKGGGSDPTNPEAFSSFGVSDPTQLTDCDPLGFHPKLSLRLFGATKRAKHPRLRAILQAHPGDANIARVSVALPHALFLDQARLGQICTRPQFAANDCPAKSIYGKARAITPLLGQPLEGPVYLRSSNNTLPDLVAHLQGQVDIDLVGRIDSFKGGVRTTFDRVPDVPVSKFTMTLPGGKHGLLVASKNLCKGKVKAIVQIKGQNGKKANKRSKLKTPCGKKSKRKKGHHRH